MLYIIILHKPLWSKTEYTHCTTVYQVSLVNQCALTQASPKMLCISVVGLLIHTINYNRASLIQSPQPFAVTTIVKKIPQSNMRVLFLYSSSTIHIPCRSESAQGGTWDYHIWTNNYGHWLFTWNRWSCLPCYYQWRREHSNKGRSWWVCSISVRAGNQSDIQSLLQIDSMIYWSLKWV